MPQTVELPDELADTLNEAATRLGLSLPEYAVRLLTQAHPASNRIFNGADLVTFWQAEGLVSGRPELPQDDDNSLLSERELGGEGALEITGS